MRRASIVLMFAALLGAALFLSHAETKLETLQQVVPGVWFREGDLLKYGHCNNIVIEMKDYLIVVDANFPSGARAVLAEVKKVSGKPVKWVFDTHHHGDHAYGNAVWTREGAITFAHKGVVEEMKAREPARWKEAQSREDVRELKLTTAEPPRQTFDKTFTLEDGTRRVEFLHFGWAHTKGDAFAYLPKEQILCTGDAVVNGPWNYTGDANLLNWPNVIRSAQKLPVQRVLPGHGSPAGAELLDGQLRFFAELRKAVEAQIKNGKKLDELVQRKAGQPSGTTVKLPDSVKNWVGRFLPGQVADMYAQLTKKP